MLIKDYLSGMLTIQQIARKYHIGVEKMKDILKKENVPHLSRSDRCILKKNQGYTIEEIEQTIVDNYVNKQWGLIKSGRQFGISENTVKKILKKHNITPRNLHEAICITNSTGERGTIYKKNENFFSVQTHEMAWLLGFLASDGNVRSNNNCIRIGLSSVDKEVLERIKKIAGIENPITEKISNRGFSYVSLEWNCKKHKEDLAKYSIVPNKTYILQPPLLLNEKYQLDYIRGYFDGDGTINLNTRKDGRKSIRWGICGASRPVLEWIVKVLEKNDVPPVRVNIERKDPLFYTIIYSTNSSKKIYHLLYDKNPKLFLKRKKDKFEDILKLFP